MGFLSRIRRTDVAGNELATPGETPPMVPVQPSVPPMLMRAPLDPSGAGSGHGRQSGTMVARQGGAPGQSAEYVPQRYDPYQPALEDSSALIVGNANTTRTRTHHQGRHWTSFHIDARHMWGVQPFFNGHHGRYRRFGQGMHLGTPSGGQIPGGGANPVVAREKPGAWDAGVVRGLP